MFYGGMVRSPFKCRLEFSFCPLLVISTTGAPRCLYCLNKRRAGCFTSAKEEKSPHPRRRRTKSAQTSLMISSASRTTYLPMLSGSRAYCGRGIRAGPFASGSDVFLCGCILFLLGGVLGEGVVSACVLTDGAGFVVVTGSIRSTPCRYPRRPAPRAP